MSLFRAAIEASTAYETLLAGMLCFVEGDWPLIGGAFTVEGLHVLWPKAAVKLLTGPGLVNDPQIRALHRSLAATFPPA